VTYIDEVVEAYSSAQAKLLLRKVILKVKYPDRLRDIRVEEITSPGPRGGE